MSSTSTLNPPINDESIRLVKTTFLFKSLLTFSVILFKSSLDKLIVE